MTPTATEWAAVETALTDPPASAVSLGLLNLASPFQALGKQSLFLKGTELLRSARSRVALVAKTPVVLLGPRPYSQLEAPISYEAEQYEVYESLIRKASAGEKPRFLCVSSLSCVEDELKELAEPDITARVKARIEELHYITEEGGLGGSGFRLTWHPGPAPMTFLVCDDHFIIWFKDGTGESVWITAKDEIIARALFSHAESLGKAFRSVCGFLFQYRTSMSFEPGPSHDFAILAAEKSEFEAVVTSPLIAEASPYQPSGIGYTRLAIEFNSTFRLTGVLTSLMNIGRVEAAVAATRVLQDIRPRWLLLLGVAGGVAESDVRLGDLVVATSIEDYEEQRITSLGVEFRRKSFQADGSLLQAAKESERARIPAEREHAPGIARPDHEGWVLYGAMLSGDKVVASPKYVTNLSSGRPDILGIEMEGGGVAVAVKRVAPKVGFLMIRGIVDLANDSKREDSGAWLQITCERVADFALSTLLRAGQDAR